MARSQNHRFWLFLLGLVLIFPGTCLALLGYLQIENREGGKIEWLADERKSLLGKVTSPATGLNPHLFYASIWGTNGTVVATSVNALHFRVFGGAEGGSVAGLSLLCKESSSTINSKHWNMERDPLEELLGSPSIRTDIPGGSGPFGQYSPRVGNAIFVSRSSSNFDPLSLTYFPGIGDILRIAVSDDPSTLSGILIENRENGAVWAIANKEKKQILGYVLQPVLGVGRFGGTQWAKPSSVRANHPGVICIATAGRDASMMEHEMQGPGGFQIVPERHARNPHMNFVGRPQWLIIKPAPGDAPLEGTYPLFSGVLRPGCKVWIRFDQGEWERLPEITGRVDNAFSASYLNSFFEKRNRKSRITKGLTEILIESRVGD
jgi:hypothetical protein